MIPSDHRRIQIEGDARKPKANATSAELPSKAVTPDDSPVRLKRGASGGIYWSNQAVPQKK
jgi:hypothetical protein